MEIAARLLAPSGWIPNNPALPLLVYKAAVDSEGGAAARFEGLFRQHGWEGIWRNGVFDYQHYHVHAHEALGIASGQASILFGGPDGIDFAVTAGDCLILPAGTGHCLIAASDDFLVVGAYPAGHNADIKTSAPSEADLAAIKGLPLPFSDPITGAPGPLLNHWRSR